MRLLQSALLALAIGLPLIGCSWMEKIKGGGGDRPKPTTQVQKVSADQLVSYLNNQASKLQTVTYADARISAREGLMSYPTLRGTLAASQPRNFRMSGQGGAMAAKIDLGSNPEQFWVYVDAPTMKPMFVYASHKDFDENRAKLPGGVPFEPDWVMQALGMMTFPTGPQAPHYEVKVNERDRTYTLSWPAATPSGMPIRKEIVFAADDADSSRHQPQVKKHIIRDAKNHVICYADVKSAMTIQVGGTDPQTRLPYVVQYPTEVVLRWEEQRFQMDLDLRDGRVNPQLTPEQMHGEFTRPNKYGPAVNLADYNTPIK